VRERQRQSERATWRVRDGMRDILCVRERDNRDRDRGRETRFRWGGPSGNRTR